MILLDPNGSGQLPSLRQTDIRKLQPCVDKVPREDLYELTAIPSVIKLHVSYLGRHSTCTSHIERLMQRGHVRVGSNRLGSRQLIVGPMWFIIPTQGYIYKKKST